MTAPTIQNTDDRIACPAANVEQKNLGSEIRQLFLGHELPELEIEPRSELARYVDFEE